MLYKNPSQRRILSFDRTIVLAGNLQRGFFLTAIAPRFRSTGSQNRGATAVSNFIRRTWLYLVE